jgi:hypothetical protein
MAAYKIKKEGDKYYSIFFLERGKSATEGIVMAGDFEDLQETEGLPWNTLVYSRDGKKEEFKKGDYDLMIESVGEIDYLSYKKDLNLKSFTVFQVESYKFKHRFDDPGLISSTDYLTIKFEMAWPDCNIKDGRDFESLIAGIRRDISLRKLGI